jgi:hypothetical protein
MSEPVELARRDPTWPAAEGEAVISEFTAPVQGAPSPFGEDLELPVPPERLRYRHPSLADRPNL